MTSKDAYKKNAFWESIESIFEPFCTTKQYGTGLGLVNCKNIIQSHGGTISVSNNKDNGVTFTIRIPKDNSNIQ